MTDFDRRTIEEFRSGGGHVTGLMAGTPLLLLHHVGVRTGIERVTPLGYLALEGGDGLESTASNGGSPRHPAWCYNLRAHPAVTVELGSERFSAIAEEQAGPARAELWRTLVTRFPDLAKFEAVTDRIIPIFLLRRVTI